MENTYTLLFSEILDKVHKAKTKSQKVAILRQHNTDALRMLLKASFDPTKIWVMPEGEVPYTPNDAPAIMTGIIANPSNPSVKLTALAEPTTTSIAKGKKKAPIKTK